MIYDLTEPGDVMRQYYDADSDEVVTVVDTDSVSRLCAEHQKYDGFTPDRSMRLVAHIELDTVKLLAKMGDMDAYAYYYEDDERARDRMINKHPEYFKACSGRL